LGGSFVFLVWLVDRFCNAVKTTIRELDETHEDNAREVQIGQYLQRG
jgi:hypothetical protein